MSKKHDPDGSVVRKQPYLMRVRKGSCNAYAKVEESVSNLLCNASWHIGYRTPGGTGVRDYIHVLDLGEEHVQALDYAFTHPRAIEINLGTSR